MLLVTGSSCWAGVAHHAGHGWEAYVSGPVSSSADVRVLGILSGGGFRLHREEMAVSAMPGSWLSLTRRGP